MQPDIILDDYVIMPNHVHLIVFLEQRISHQTPQQASPLSAIIRGFKGTVTTRINTLRGVSCTRVWQHNYYEYIIRSDKALTAIRDYIQMNPSKWAEDKENPANLA